MEVVPWLRLADARLGNFRDYSDVRSPCFSLVLTAFCYCILCVQIFPSTAQYGRWYWASIWVSVLVFLLLLFAGAGIHHSAQTIVIIVAFVFL
jgi:hypothetical protein